MKQTARFKTSAYYYKNKEGENCRKYLDIKTPECRAPGPQLIILTLNPGGCDEDAHVELEKDIEVKADPMLHRIQHFMEKHALAWVRMLNLSDIQEKTSEMFFKKLRFIERGNLPEHSIFHPSRKDELERHARVETPFLLAWGKDKRKEALANNVVKRIKEQGYSILNEQGPHIHPLTRPGLGLPRWTEYADELYRDFLNKKSAVKVIGQAPLQSQSLNDKIDAAFKLFNNFDFGNPIITSAHTDGRWDRFAKLLKESGAQPYLGTSQYDYVFTDNVANASALIALLECHSSKKIIIDTSANPQILSTAECITILENILCLPKNHAKIAGRTGRKPFRFTGKIALLTDLRKEELAGDERFAMLIRDCIVV